MGAYKNPLICDEKEFACGIGKIAKCKKNCFAMITRLLPILLTKNTFVYFDPPYRPITDTASFLPHIRRICLMMKNKSNLHILLMICIEKGAKK